MILLYFWINITCLINSLYYSLLLKTKIKIKIKACKMSHDSHQYCLALTHKLTPSPSIFMFVFNLKQIVRKMSEIRAGLVLCKLLIQLAYFGFESSQGPYQCFFHNFVYSIFKETTASLHGPFTASFPWAQVGWTQCHKNFG